MKCPASAKVVFTDDKWILAEGTDNHCCEPNRPRLISESLKCRMKEIVKSDPAKPVGNAIRRVREQAFANLVLCCIRKAASKE